MDDPQDLTCPICQGEVRPSFVKNGHQIYECPACGHLMARAPADVVAHVADTYGDTYFTGGGAGYSDYLGEADLLRAAGRRYGELLARHTRPGRILDVGAAAGFLLQGYAEAGWSGVGIEPNAAMARHARDELGLDVRVGTLETLDGEETFDAVSIVQVIGHFADPRLALERAAARLRPGGLLLIECWNRRSLTARLFGRNWHEFSPPSVLHWYSIDGLRRLGEGIGLGWVARGRPAKRLNGAHAKSLLKHKLAELPGGRVLAACVDVVPDGVNLVYPFDDVFWALFAKPAPGPR